MALPNDQASSTPVLADYVPPYDRYKGPLEDFEQGGIALNDPTEGLEVQIWKLEYNDDEDSPNYGDFTVTAEDTLESAVIINVPDVVRVGLSFNQNNDPIICYETKTCEAKYYYYDTVALSYLTATLPAGSRYMATCLDDHRESQTGSSDAIIAYIRSGTLYYRQERERFTIERSLGAVGAAILYRAGMAKNLRLLFDVREGNGVRLSEIEGDICLFSGLRSTDINVEALYPAVVRGFIVAGIYPAADILRALMAVYFHDMVEVDGVLLAVPRGGPVKGTIYRRECSAGEGIDIETAREQGLEFPYKTHLAYTCAESDYTPTKATSERTSINIKSTSELSIETAVNFTPEEAYQRAHIIEKEAWATYEGTAEFGIPENFASYIPTDCINLEVREGVTKRFRLVRMLFGEGYFKTRAVMDRASAYTSGAVSLLPTAPETPPPTLPGSTTWYFLDLPALLTSLDSEGLHYYVVARGDAGTAWHGAQLQRQVGTNFLKEADIPTSESMGQVEEAFPTASRHIPDTTNTLLVSLTKAPESVTDAEIYSGRNAFLIGNEIVQVRDWVAEGNNWRGSYLLRGRLDTPIAASAAIGTRAIFLGNPVVVPADVSLLDTTLTLRAPSYGQQGSQATPSNHLLEGKSQEEWAPIDLVSTRHTPATNDWSFSWTPRYRLGSSANPIPSAHFYGWRLRFTVGATVITKTVMSTTPTFLYTEAAQQADWGAARATFDNLEIVGLNYMGGEGKPLNEAIS